MEKKTSDMLDRVISECLDRYLNEETLYRCYDDNIAGGDFIWLSDGYADDYYGKNTAEFNIPLSRLRIADRDTVIRYIMKYDIPSWDDAMYDEYINYWVDNFDWKRYERGEITDEEAYANIPIQSWTEVMEHPDYYSFAERLREDGYDGYSFMYFGDGNPTYYAFFNPDEILRYRVS